MGAMKEFRLANYHQARPFASFLSGISGKKGIPMWAFYVNRGQVMASFGLRDKNGAIMEFFPANAMYRHLSRIGFRTFVKREGKIHEFFLEGNPNQEMVIRPDQVSITETCSEIGLAATVTYFTLPNETLAGLVRKVEIVDLNGTGSRYELVDGLAQLLTTGIDYGGYKAVSHLLQSWMESENHDDFMFFSLRASTGDSAKVSDALDGNFYLTVSDKKPQYISDIGILFGEDTSLATPYGFIQNDVKALAAMPQTHVNQVPCGFSAFEATHCPKLVFHTLIGHANDRREVWDLLPKLTPSYFDVKEEENRLLNEGLAQPISTKTARPELDAYFRQCFLDNVIRGGTPWIVDTLDGKIGYHLFSRKHGDLERDYNFFSIEPAFYSQGNGAFRDVLQNRRNDILFEPKLGDFSIRQFGSLIQADGYNPLSVEGIKFTYVGDPGKYPEPVAAALKGEFTPGSLYTKLRGATAEAETKLEEILAQSHYEIKATFGEGYWEDHFTYLLDLIEAYLVVYPDKEESLLFTPDYPFFVSPAHVLSREEKYVLTSDRKVRQYDAVKHLTGAPSSGWLRGADGHKITVDLFGKLLTLALTKFAHLDPDGVGLMYEADKPGWNDAMNGVPGLFGSGVSEMIELRKLVKFLLSVAERHPDADVRLLQATCSLAQALAVIDEKTPFDCWDKRMAALEAYRASLLGNQIACLGKASARREILIKMDAELDLAQRKAKQIRDIYPTYLVREATDYETIVANGEIKKGHNGLPLVRVKAFATKPLPAFLEAPARYLSGATSKEEALEIHKSVRTSGLYDAAHRFYQTSEPLDAWTNEIGRIRAFTPGWLERESNFLHMTYKYLLGLLKAGLYPEFYEEMTTNFTCFMDSNVYGRSPLENSSFLATSRNPDPKKRGQGFYARLSGSTAEVISMWRLMFIGKAPFRIENGQLTFRLEPKLPASLFDEGIIETTLLGSIRLVYHNQGAIDTYLPEAGIANYIISSSSGRATTITGTGVDGPLAHAIRNGQVREIHAYIERRTN